MTVVPAKTNAKEILSYDPDGVVLSNGPGDPDAVSYGKTLVKDIAKESVPCFGICRGHQMIALGLGAKTYKLKFGHRGGNQPVKNLVTGSVEITSQNHGFAVDNKTLGKEWDPLFININDQTNEGMIHKTKLFFSTQFHPEASGGPTDTGYLFDVFIENIKKSIL